MSRQNVELVHQAINAFNRRDLEGFLSLMDRDVEFVPYERALEGGGAYHGHTGVRRWWDDSFEALPDLRAELEDVRDLGDLILARGRLRGRGAASGVSFDRTLWLVVEFGGGREIWWHAFDSEPEALEAVRLRTGEQRPATSD